MKDGAELQHLLRAALARRPEERKAYVRDHTSGDPDTTEQILALLEEFDDGGPDVVAADLGPDLLTEAIARKNSPAFLPGTRVGAFVLERQIGRGGMGSVFLARREDPSIEQRVAIKFLHPGLLDSKALCRFQSEEKILARLIHPSIARFYDASVTETGTPYFLMEYVEGQPITRYCEANQSTVEERLRLFVEVCDAVQYAQQNLIVHRDIKPGNVFVTKYGRVKLLDFGVAKIIDPIDSDATQTQTRLLTPAYATPEQVGVGRITTATDVYALGVLLFELLSGRLPYDANELSQAELIRAISETVPDRVSVAVMRAVGGRQGVASNIPTHRLQKRLRGDLDAIVERCLRKNPADRYASAEALGDDLRRHLDGVPVSARKGSRWYAAKRWGNKYRRELLAACLVVVGVIAGLSTFAYTLSAKEDQLVRERSQLIEWGRVYREVFTGGGTLMENIDSSFDRVAHSYDNDPETRALLLQVIGNMYGNLKAYDQGVGAQELAIRSSDSLGRPSMARAYALGSLAILLADSSGSSYHERWPLDELVFDALREGAAAGQPRTDFLRVAFQLDVIQRIMKTPGRDRKLVDSLLLSLSTLEREESLDPDLRDAIGYLGAARVAEREATSAEAFFVE